MAPYPPVAQGMPIRPAGRKTPSCRLVERLYVEEELSPRQIAERLGLTPGQVRYDLLRLGIASWGSWALASACSAIGSSGSCSAS